MSLNLQCIGSLSGLKFHADATSISLEYNICMFSIKVHCHLLGYLEYYGNPPMVGRMLRIRMCSSVVRYVIE